MGASTAERMRVVELLLPTNSAVAFDRPEEGSGDRDPSEVSDVISLPVTSLPVNGVGSVPQSAAPSVPAAAPSSSVPATSSSEPALHSVPAVVGAVASAVSAEVAAVVAAVPVTLASTAPPVQGDRPLTVAAAEVDPADARVTPPAADAFSESIQRWMRQGDILSERGIRAAEDLSDLDAGLAPILRARAIRAARVRRWLSVAAAVVVGSVAALWVTHALSPAPGRPGLAAPKTAPHPTNSRVAAPPPALLAPAAPAQIASATAPMLAASGAKSAVASPSRAQPHRHRAANRHHGRR